MSLEYIMQALLLIVIVVVTFAAMLLWTRFKKRNGK